MGRYAMKGCKTMKDPRMVIRAILGARSALAVLLVFMALALGTSAALAQDGDDPSEQQPAVESAEDNNETFTEELDDIAPFESWQMISSALVAGFIVPIVTKRRYTDEVRTLIALGVAAVTAIGGSYFRGELDNLNYTSASVMQMAFLVFTSYQTIWKAKFFNAVPTAIEGKILP